LRKLPYIAITLFLLLNKADSIFAQQYDLLLKNGHVIDPKNNLDRKMDVALKEGKIARVAASIESNHAKRTIDVQGLFVAPGFIDIHTHVFVGSKPETFADGSNSVSPDDFTLRSGVTTVVDAGTSGWRNFPVFKSNVIDKSKTRVFAWLNIAGNGMTGSPAEQDMSDMDPRLTSAAVRKFRNHIVGIKIGHYEGADWSPFQRAVNAATQVSMPLFVECHLPKYPLEQQLKNMRPGDIITHSFERVSERMPIVDDSGKVYPFVKAARQRGILFDLGHGGAGFWYNVAVPAMKDSLAPDTFGSDMHRFSINAGMKDMANIISKYIAMGMLLPDAISRATWNAAKAIRHEELGNLSVGSEADLCVFALREGQFGYVDAGGNLMEGRLKLEAELTIIRGKILYDLNGLSARPFQIRQ
jgi:dihydroorotase